MRSCRSRTCPAATSPMSRTRSPPPSPPPRAARPRRPPPPPPPPRPAAVASPGTRSRQEEPAAPPCPAMPSISEQRAVAYGAGLVHCPRVAGEQAGRELAVQCLSYVVLSWPPARRLNSKRSMYTCMISCNMHTLKRTYPVHVHIISHLTYHILFFSTLTRVMCTSYAPRGLKRKK
jgi:hypothetical protein